MKLIRYEIVPLPTKEWLFYRSGVTGTASIHDTKKAALQFARELISGTYGLYGKQGGVTLRIHKLDGRFQEERTYPRKADPKKSKG